MSSQRSILPLVAALLMLTSLQASAQVVSGKLTDTDGTPIPNATVRAYTPDGNLVGATISRVTGDFRISGDPNIHTFTLVFDHVSYQSFSAVVERADGLELEAVMELGAIVLPEVGVETESLTLKRRRVRSGFEQRRAENRGAFLGPDDGQGWRASGVQGLAQRIPFLVSGGLEGGGINRRASATNANLLMRTMAGTTCAPTIYVDGHHVLSDSGFGFSLPPDVQALEAYQSAIAAPSPFDRMVGYTDLQCGVVLIWTPHTEDDAESKL